MIRGIGDFWIISNLLAQYVKDWMQDIKFYFCMDSLTKNNPLFNAKFGLLILTKVPLLFKNPLKKWTLQTMTANEENTVFLDIVFCM